jgi:hypothetical protein
MNKQIKELLDRATIEAMYETQDAVELMDKSIARQQRELQLEKFALLIVQKCADIGQQYADGNYEVYNQILEYFGVEE